MMRWIVCVLVLSLCACTDSEVFTITLDPLEETIELGVVRPDVTTVQTVVITKPFVPGGTAELVGTPTGPFAPESGTFPTEVKQGVEFAFRLRFDPDHPEAPAPGSPAQGSFRLRFTRGGGGFVRDSILTVHATPEKLSIELSQSSVTFGRTAIGEVISRVFQVRNPNTATPIEVTSTSGLPAEMKLVTPLPRQIAPGGGWSIEVQYAPTATGPASGTLALQNSVGPALNVGVSGEGMPGEIVIDLGTLPVDPSTFETPEVSVDLPPEAVSFTIEMDGDPDDILFPSSMTGPGGQVYIDENNPFDSPYPVSLIALFLARAWQVPNSDRQGAQLVQGGGTYRFRIESGYGLSPLVSVRVVIEQRNQAAAKEGTLDINVFLASGLAVDAAQAPDDPKMSDALDSLDLLLGQAGLRVGEVSFYDLNDPGYDILDSIAEIDNMFMESSAATDVRLNLFFVVGVGGSLHPNLLGRAGGIPGRKQNGTASSGVMIVYESSSAFEVAGTAAHEGGHFLGLFHPVEQDGVTVDPIDDTPVCPVSGAVNAECPTPGDSNLMWWLALAEALQLTPGQGSVILRHTFVEPGTPLGRSSIAQLAANPMLTSLAYMRPPSREWCGNCAEAYANGR